MATKVFFTHRVSGAPEDDPNARFYDAIRTALEENRGIVLADKKKKKKTEREGKSPEDIYHGIMHTLENENVTFLVAEVTYSSFGVGYEIGWAHTKGINVLCLYRIQPDRGLDHLSPMITGACGKKFFLETYTTVEEAKAILTRYMK